MISRRVIYLGVDVQRAFGKEAVSPKLKTLATGQEGNEDREIQNNASLAEAVYHSGGTVIVTKDWHNPVGTRIKTPSGEITDNRSSDEFDKYDSHALAGSSDSELNGPLEQTLRRLEAEDRHGRSVIPVDEYDPTGKRDSDRLFEVHKNIYDIGHREVLQDGVIEGPVVANDAFLDIIRAQAAASPEPLTLVLGGKIAEVCVRAGALSLLAAIPGLRLVIPEDAVSSLPSSLDKALNLPTKAEVLADLKQRGAEVVKTDELLGWLAAG